MNTKMIRRGNLFAGIPGSLPEERVDVLTEGSGKGRVERIVSRGHASAPDFWYDQETREWVVLLKGAAVLRFYGQESPVELRPGDWVEIPPHCRHRVEETSGVEDCVWLAVHWG